MTPAQMEALTTELFTMLNEECSEVIKEGSKLLRHGPHSYHPADPEKTDNVELVRREVQDIVTVVWLINQLTNHTLPHLGTPTREQIQRKARYMHHLPPGFVLSPGAGIQIIGEGYA